MPRVQFHSPADAGWRALRFVAPLRLPVSADGGCDVSATALLIPGSDCGPALVAAPSASVRVNGRLMPGGLRVLAERDEIRIGETRYYYTSRDSMAVEAYPGLPASCPRCSGMIQPGSDAVRCHCGAWFHQSGDRPCYTYGETCPLCSVPTCLEDDPWNPSAL